MTDGLASYSGVGHLEIMADAVNYNSFIAAQLRRYMQPGQVAIDFGAGAGTFAMSVKSWGVDVICIEPDNGLRSALIDKGLTAYPSLAAVAEESVDLLYSLNVVEHIEDDARAIAEMRTKLRQSGTLFLYVPAFNVLYSAMDRKVGHFRRYSRRSLTRLIDDAGLRINRIEYVDCLGFVATLAYKLIGDKEGDIDSGQLKFYDRFIFPVSSIMDRALNSIIGKNLLLVAQK
jgi:SAM-dependent methyltransferase